MKLFEYRRLMLILISLTLIFTFGVITSVKFYCPVAPQIKITKIVIERQKV